MSNIPTILGEYCQLRPGKTSLLQNTTNNILIMKSRRAEQVLQAASFTNEYDYQYVCIDSAYAAVELAERDAEKEIAHYRKELEESKQREELALRVINDKRKEIERLKARVVETFRESCPIKHPGLNDKGALCNKIDIIGFDCNCPVVDCKFLLNFLEKLNEQ